jgi:hypothetical protein
MKFSVNKTTMCGDQKLQSRLEPLAESETPKPRLASEKSKLRLCNGTLVRNRSEKTVSCAPLLGDDPLRETGRDYNKKHNLELLYTPLVSMILLRKSCSWSGEACTRNIMCMTLTALFPLSRISLVFRIKSSPAPAK